MPSRGVGRTCDKIEAVAAQVYGARDIFLWPEAEREIAHGPRRGCEFTHDGHHRLPVCIAKTNLSLSADPSLLNAPEGFTLPVRDIRAYTGPDRWFAAVVWRSRSDSGSTLRPR